MGTTLRRATAPTIPHIASALFLLRPLPAFDKRLAYAAPGKHPRGHLARYGGPCGNRGAFADRHRRNEFGVVSNEDIVFYDGSMLVRAVVIADDRACAEVDVRTDSRITDIREVIRLGAHANVTRFHFDEVAEVDAFSKTCTGPQTRERPDIAALADRRVFHVAQSFDAGIRADRYVPKYAIRSDDDPVAKRDRAFEHAIHIDPHIAPTGEAPAHIQPRGVRECDTLIEQPLRVFPLIDALELCQVTATVYSQNVGAVRSIECRGGHAVLQRKLHHVGQVVLLLRIVIGKPFHPSCKAAGWQRHEAGVHLPDGALLCGCITLFDDVAERAVCRTN